jgi:hypothetical protein
MSGRIELIGVYRLPVTDELVQSQAEVLYGANPSSDQHAQARRQLESTALVEVLVTDADRHFNVTDFAQEDTSLSRANWQAAWAEAFLSSDGQNLLVERWAPLPAQHTTFRVAFFIHQWKVGGPLLSSYGSMSTAQPTSMPDRLHRLVPYETVD